MGVQFYVESADRPPQSGVANESITPGELVTDDGAGVNKFSFSDGDYDGLALFEPEYVLAVDEDEVTYPGTYDTGDRVRFHPSEDAAVVRVRTPEDNSQTAPSIGHRDVVGVIDDSDGDAPAGSVGRVVEEGYTADANGDGTSTTFNRSSSNFLAVGRAYRPGKQNGDTVSDFDDPIRVVLFEDAKA